MNHHIVYMVVDNHSSYGMFATREQAEKLQNSFMFSGKYVRIVPKFTGFESSSSSWPQAFSSFSVRPSRTSYFFR